MVGYLVGYLAGRKNKNYRQLVSDTGKIAEYLFFPHWFWATLIIIVSSLIFWVSLNIAYGSKD